MLQDFRATGELSQVRSQGQSQRAGTPRVKYRGRGGSAEGESRATAHLERSPRGDEPGQWGQQEAWENARPK